MPGSCNDINIVERSPFISNILHGTCPSVSWKMTGKEYTNFYMLADGIYPEVGVFVSWLLVALFFFCCCLFSIEFFFCVNVFVCLFDCSLSVMC